MPRIPVYSNGVYPDAGPMAEAARSAGFAGRQIGSSLQQGWNALGQGVNAVQAGFEKRAAEKEEHEARVEINNTTVAAAKLDAQLAVDWQDTLATADPNDPNVAENFVNGRVTTAWDALGANLKTERGRMHFATQRAQAWAQAYKGAHSDQAAMSAAQAVQNIEDIGVNRSSAAYTQPGSWKDQVSAMERDLDAIAETNNVGYADREKLKDKYRKEIAEGALRKLVATNPDEAKRAIAAGEFNGILTGEELGIQNDRATGSKTALENDAKQAENEKTRAQRDLADAELGVIQSGIEFNTKTGLSTVPPDYFTKLRDWQAKHGTSADEGKYRTAYNFGVTESRRKASDDVTSDPDIKERLRKRALAGEDITDDVRNARMQDLLDAKDTSILMEWGKSNDNPKEDNKYLEGYLSSREDVIGSGNQFRDKVINSAWKKARIADYKSDMTKKYKEAMADGWTEEQFEAYANKAIRHYDYDQNALTKELKRAKKAKEAFQPPTDVTAPPLVGNDKMPTEEDFNDTSGVDKLDKAQANAGAPDGPRKNIVTKQLAGRAPLNMNGLKSDVLDKWELVQGKLGYKLAIVSAFRDPASNAQAGGAKGSQHIHGNAIDVDASGLSKQERLHVIRVARSLGFKGVGVYANALHFDIGTKRAWGPDFSDKTIPSWALETVQGT